MLILGLPHDVGDADALHVAGAVGKLQAIDFRFDLHENYTIWSGLIGGMFLSLSYFGCDQSQVQRYLTAKSLHAEPAVAALSAFVKIPLQALILLTGVFVVHVLPVQPAPMLFNPVHDARRCCASPRGAEYRALEREYEADVRGARVAAATALAGAERDGRAGRRRRRRRATRSSRADARVARRARARRRRS